MKALLLTVGSQGDVQPFVALAVRLRAAGHEAVLDALQSYERRIIHNTLSDDPDVFTYSEGEEPDRRVVISPRNGEPGEGGGGA